MATVGRRPPSVAGSSTLADWLSEQSPLDPLVVDPRCDPDGGYTSSLGSTFATDTTRCFSDDEPADGHAAPESPFEPAPPVITRLLPDFVLHATTASLARGTLKQVREDPDLLPVVADRTVPADQPAFDQPAFDQPAFGQPAFGHPAFGEPVFDQPVFDQPSFGQPTASQPAISRPAASQPVASQPVTSHTAASQPIYLSPDGKNSRHIILPIPPIIAVPFVTYQDQEIPPPSRTYYFANSTMASVTAAAATVTAGVSNVFRKGMGAGSAGGKAPAPTSGGHRPGNGKVLGIRWVRRLSTAASGTATPANISPTSDDDGGPQSSSLRPGDYKGKGRASTGLPNVARLAGPATGGDGATPASPVLRRAASLEDVKGLASGSGPTSANSNTNGFASVSALTDALAAVRTYDAAEDPGVRPGLTPTRIPWAFPPDAGTGIKARRMSLSLPDDFTVDVAELTKEFGYYNKLLGRHGRHLGKGATSRVNIMARKKCPDELYAVKEFRGKSRRETQKEYEKKVKSEYSIAKSLHHPNIVETFRLCRHHGRWNHVMEYCSEGDMFSLVQKGYLREDGRQGDRLCLFKQLVHGIRYLHANGIAHRDIKLENLLVTKDSKLRITDFGVSEVFAGIHPGLREAGGQCGIGMCDGHVRLCAPGICGSEPYIAPEVLARTAAYDPRPLDVWSAAIIMVNLVFGGGLWGRADNCDDRYVKYVGAWEKFETEKGRGIEDPADKPAESVDKPAESIDKPTESVHKPAESVHKPAESVHKSAESAESADKTEMSKGKGAVESAVAGLVAGIPAYYPFDRMVKPLALRRVLLQMLHPDPAKRVAMEDVVAMRWFRNIECCQPDSYEDPEPIDASKPKSLSARRLFCHNHLPPPYL